MKKQERFSLRKYKIGAVSVLLGAVFLLGGPSTVFAAEQGQTSSIGAETTVQTSTTVQTTAETPSEVASEVVVETTETLATEAITEGTSGETATSAVAEKVEIAELKETPAATEIVEAIETVATDSAETATIPTDSVTKAVASTEKPVEESVVTAVATSSSETPQNIDSNTIITVPEVWDSGYKGEGTVVAIIDSGLDVEHDVLQLTDISKAKYTSQDQLEAAKTAAGITYGEWFSDKVIFGYNYVDVNTVLKEEDKSSHGMHVTSIAAGNPTVPNGGELIYGVAPEAQVMFMRVFSDLKSTTGPALYVKAIEDAVKLGADSINLSLGGANGSVVNMDSTVDAAIAAARKAGVTVVIAAGNDGTFGSGHSNPTVENPDYGLVGNPSTARDAISVASYNNTTVSSQVVNIIGLENNADLNYGKSSFNNPEKSPVKFEIGKAYDYVFAGLGQAEDFTDLDLTGKLALIKRGSITFSEKIANATAAGAAGVVIYNSRPGEANVSMSLDDTAIAIPSIFIPYEFGEALAANTYQIQFNNESDKQPNPEAGVLSDFSSWGLSADGELKPDLAAPGGSIYAAINDNEYGSMNGTSMAAPHVAGAAVLVKQYLLQTYPDKSQQEIEALVKHLLMSTAKAHYNTDTQAYTSPRQQGAGIIDTAAAISSGVYLTGADGYSSITLGNVADTFSFEVTLHNITNQDKTFSYVTDLNTDTVADGYFSLTPRLLEETAGQTVTVKANSSTTLTISLDATAFVQELTEQMPNGYFLEGFVRFTDTVDGVDIVSIPYVGFRGAFQNLAVVEEPIYNLIADGQGGFYFEPVAEEPLTVDISNHYTGLVTSSSEVIYSTDKRTDLAIKTLGTYKNEAGNFILELDENGKPHLALSPNGDNNQDSLAFKGVFLRNYSELVASVYAADDTERTKPLWTSEPNYGDKNFFSGNPKNPKSTVVYPTEWAGTDQEGNDLADGNYQYVLTYYSDVPGADVQTMVFDVVIDRQAPVITTATYDETSQVFDPRQAIENGPSGIFREQVFYLATNDAGMTMTIDLDENGQVVVTDNKVFVAQNADGSFTLPLDLADISNFYYTVEDYAGNLVSAKVADLISIGNDLGLVTVNLLDQATNSPASILYSYSVKDASGKVVTELPRYAENDSILKLPFGTYTFDLFLYDTEWSTLAGETSVTVEITEENSTATVDFYVTLRDKASLLVDVDKALPAGTTVTLVTENGQIIVLPNAKYSTTDYGKFVPVGDYTLSATLPVGYEFLEDLAISVIDDKRNVKTLTLINKTELLSNIASLQGIEATVAYYNADAANQEAYKTALAGAEAIVAAKHNQAEVDAALASLLAAKDALNGLPTDTSALLAEVARYEDVRKESVYYNADATKQAAYDTLLRAAQLVLATENVTQVAVNQALASLEQARIALDGQATDRTELAELISGSDLVKTTDSHYINASLASREAYEQALQAAQIVLADATASQAVVNQAVESLKEAQAALDGQATDRTELAELIAASDLVKTTDSHYINASLASREAYEQALQAAQSVLSDPTASQAVVNQAAESLKVAQTALDGRATDRTELAELIAASDLVKTTDSHYINASLASRKAYEQALQAAQIILADANASQAVVNQAVESLKATQAALDGQATDYVSLRNLVAVSSVLKATDAKYLNASEVQKAAYDQALDAAQLVLADASASQAAVDQALATLKAAQEALDGVATATTEEPKEPTETPTKPITEEQTPPEHTEVSNAGTGSQPQGIVNKLPKLKVPLPTQNLIQLKATNQHPLSKENGSSNSSSLTEKTVETSSPDSSNTQLPNTGQESSIYVSFLGLLGLVLTSFNLLKKNKID
ncbi:TPA: S8 family serine peptidase [Streptococcus suis]